MHTLHDASCSSRLTCLLLASALFFHLFANEDPPVTSEMSATQVKKEKEVQALFFSKSKKSMHSVGQLVNILED